jgi:hypothetical protein
VAEHGIDAGVMTIPPEQMISILAVTLLGVGGLLSMLPVGTCAQCNHCRLEKLEHDRRQLQADGGVGVPFCPVCGRHHRPNEDHPI